MSLLQALAALGSHGAFLHAAALGEIASDLAGPETFTVFAPTDAAFARLPAGTIERLRAADGGEPLVDLLEYHLVRGRFEPDEGADLACAPTVHGLPLAMRRRAGGLEVGGAAVGPELRCRNGVLVVIDRVLAPPRSRAARIIERRAPVKPATSLARRRSDAGLRTDAPIVRTGVHAVVPRSTYLLQSG